MSMTHPRLRLLALATAVFAVSLAHADEGMWQPQQMGKLDKQLKARGLKMDPAALTDLTRQPLNAVISLGGCTASLCRPTAWSSPITTAATVLSNSTAQWNTIT